MQPTDAHRLALSLMGEHDLLLTGWTFRFDKAAVRFGVCRYEPRVISLSIKAVRLNNEAIIRDVILHEIAHALCGHAAGHGPLWRATARRIGCRAQRCVPSEAIVPPTPYVGVCPKGHEFERHRRPKGRASCTACSPRFDTRFIIEWRKR